jgi:hypothetical protein
MKLSRRSFFVAAAALGGAATLAAGKIAKPRPESKPGTKGAGDGVSAHARKYYRTAKI